MGKNQILWLYYLVATAQTLAPNDAFRIQGIVASYLYNGRKWRLTVSLTVFPVIGIYKGYCAHVLILVN